MQDIHDKNIDLMEIRFYYTKIHIDHFRHDI